MSEEYAPTQTRAEPHARPAPALAVLGMSSKEPAIGHTTIAGRLYHQVLAPRADNEPPCWKYAGNMAAIVRDPPASTSAPVTIRVIFGRPARGRAVWPLPRSEPGRADATARPH